VTDRRPRPAEPFLFVVLGATGDLTRRKLLPAVYRLLAGGLVEAEVQVLGVGRTELGDEEFRAWARDALAEAGLDGGLGAWCDDCLHYLSVGEEGGVDYGPLARRIAEIEEAAELPGNRLLYLALPPSAFGPAVEALGAAGLDRSPGWTRLVVEKPFGRDLGSARELNRLVHRVYDEEQVYRIDHYLGKETVQNLLVFRFSNMVFESLWNRERVRSVQVTVAEDLGIGGRGGYYDRSGALRDMVQNHVTQLLTLIGMEVPVAYDAESVRYEKIKVLRAIQPIDPARDVVLGQYREGSVDGDDVPGYLDEDRVADGSRTETFAALRLWLDTWRWQGVPFVVRTGKRLARRVTEIAVVFRRPPVALFQSLGCEQTLDADVLAITVQPDEGFSLFFDLKVPGEPLRLRKETLHFRYSERFDDLPEAYETLLLDVVQGDQTLFVHADEVEASWRLYTPLLDAGLPVHPYPAGSWGPEAARGLLPDDAGWHTR